MTQIIPGSTSRPQYWEKNPAKKVNQTSVNHGATATAYTNRMSYTVPAGKKAFVEFLEVLCRSASTTAIDGNVLSAIGIVVDGGSLKDVLHANLEDGQASIAKENVLGSVGLLLAGDEIRHSTQSANEAVGSDVRTSGSWVITEFDA